MYLCLRGVFAFLLSISWGRPHQLETVAGLLLLSVYPASLPVYPESLPVYPASLPVYPASLSVYHESLPVYPESLSVCQ